jgi:putative membrane protein
MVVLVIACVVVCLAALLHVYIFWMESVGWRRPAVWRRFGVADQDQADANRDLAYNQGFYNLFLAIGAITGVVLLASGLHAAGYALVFLSAGSMLAASLVLLSLGRRFAAAALTQGLSPLIGLALTAIAIATSR